MSDINRPLICYPDMFGTEVACYETDETSSTAQFEDGFVFEERGTSLEEIRAEDLGITSVRHGSETNDKISRARTR